MSSIDSTTPTPVRSLFDEPNAHLRAIELAETTERRLRHRAAARNVKLTVTERSVIRGKIVVGIELELADGTTTDAFIEAGNLDAALRSLDWAVDNKLAPADRSDVRRIAEFFATEFTTRQQEVLVRALREEGQSEGGVIVNYDLGWRPTLSDIDPEKNDLPYDRITITGPLTFTLHLGDDTFTRRLEPINEVLETELLNLDQNYEAGFQLKWFDIEIGGDKLSGDATLLLRSAS